MTQREAQRHEADAVAGRGVVLPFAFGRELGSQRLKLRIMKLNCPAKLNSPDTFNLSELALHCVVNHSRERLKSWDLPNYKPSNSATESWAHEACLAGSAISASNEAGANANYRVLSKAALDFNRILQKQEPMLVWSTCTIVIQLFEMDVDLALYFIRVVLHFCRTQLQDNNPLLTLWKAISRTNPDNIRGLITQIAAAQLDYLRQEIGTANSFVVKYIKSSAKYLHDRKLLEPFEAHKQMDSVILALQQQLRQPGSDYEASLKNQFISANLFQACIYLDYKQWDSVDEILERIEPEVKAGFGIDPAQVVNFYEIKAEMLMERGDSERGDYVLSEEHYQKALIIAQQRLSETMPGRTGYVFVALVELYRRAGNTIKLEETQARYNEHVKRMAGDVTDQLPFAGLRFSESEQEE
ncbi:hypothetical protein G7054_g2342 [Neopestalotiopsis clavispora]|nr:hypothetical protein G7054_g2342 [Neopestalotiopsis clavispora]